MREGVPHVDRANALHSITTQAFICAAAFIEAHQSVAFCPDGADGQSLTPELRRAGERHRERRTLLRRQFGRQGQQGALCSSGILAGRTTGRLQRHAARQQLRPERCRGRRQGVEGVREGAPSAALAAATHAAIRNTASLRPLGAP